eukprot:NODE_3674_length_2001_cov_7.636073.p7 GENE.NODE_3674_length_2001_cov_7.636073~~NODE_3674_length_2001_cov_7.636073.p7  ORF type:complete len:76 (-),score=6.55 NODE_3674_length_2001_cov_7.636073:1432-1659(-)
MTMAANDDAVVARCCEVNYARRRIEHDDIAYSRGPCGTARAETDQAGLEMCNVVALSLIGRRAEEASECRKSRLG